MKIIECVPNVSEGRDQKVLDALAAVVNESEGVELLDVDPGRETNRTVFTFVGAPDPLAEAAFRFAAKAIELIDMSHHSGAHPRMGAIDVCPFVPVGGGATMDDCVELARRVGRRLGEELALPVYLYEAAASRPERHSLAEVRRGEYEALEDKLTRPEWAPDFGPARFNARAGATAVGARPFLIAYNVNLNTAEKKRAHDIALDVREQGRLKRDEAGKIMRDAEGNKLRHPGRFPNVRAVGWTIPEFGRAQVSINLTNFEVTPPHVVFDAISEEARTRGLRVTGSEIVGLVPREALLAAGRHYLSRQGATPAVPVPDLVHAARMTLGLDDVKPFAPEELVVEERVAPRLAGLRAKSLVGFSDELARATPAPGGGSVAAYLGALGTGLTTMVAALTHPGAPDEERGRLEELGARAEALRERLLRAVDDDTAAFEAMVAARRMRKKSPEEQAAREEAMLAATRQGIAVPMSVLEAAAAAAALSAEVAAIGLEAAASDCGVSAWCARAAGAGAALNVRINLAGLPEGEERHALRARVDDLLAELEARANEALMRVDALVG